MSLDVGSIGKGYVVQKVASMQKMNLESSTCFFFGRGNVCAIGGHRMEAPGREFRT